MSQEALFVLNPNLGKPALPDLAGVSEFLLQPVGESALDELHDSFYRHSLPTVSNRCTWSGMTTKSCNRNFPAARHTSVASQRTALRCVPTATICGPCWS